MLLISRFASHTGQLISLISSKDDYLLILRTLMGA